MIEAPSHVQNIVESFAKEACLSLFEAYGVPLQVIDPEAPLSNPVVLTGAIGFTGPSMRGTCIRASTEGPLKQSNPTNGSLRDWTAELANQLVGRVKNHLLRGGAEVY